jgi:hypothetical protein
MKFCLFVRLGCLLVALVVLALALAGWTPASAATYPASTPAELALALTKVNPAGSDVIRLASGTWPAISVTGYVRGPVTITSDPLNRAALGGLRVNNSKDITLAHLEMVCPKALDEAGTNAKCGVINYSTGITLYDVHVHGTLDNDPSRDIVGLVVKGGGGIRIERSEFEQLRVGVTFGQVRGLALLGNSFHDIRTDGIDCSSSQRVIYRHNYFANFHHLAGDHSDAIQCLTAGQTVGSSDITIEDNLVDVGDGDVMQGTWLQDEVGTLPYKNLTVRNNLYIGTNWNGIGIDNAQSLVLDGDQVLSRLGDKAATGAPQQSWIKVIGGSTGVARGNAASSVNLGAGVVGSNNVAASVVADRGTAAIAAWCVTRPEVPRCSALWAQ